MVVVMVVECCRLWRKRHKRKSCTREARIGSKTASEREKEPENVRTIEKFKLNSIQSVGGVGRRTFYHAFFLPTFFFSFACLCCKLLLHIDSHMYSFALDGLSCHSIKWTAVSIKFCLFLYTHTRNNINIPFASFLLEIGCCWHWWLHRDEDGGRAASAFAHSLFHPFPHLICWLLHAKIYDSCKRLSVQMLHLLLNMNWNIA